MACNNILRNVLTAVIVTETILLARSFLVVRDQNDVIKTLEDVSNYYVYILDKNDVPLTKYDLIALNSMFSKTSVIEIEDDAGLDE